MAWDNVKMSKQSGGIGISDIQLRNMEQNWYGGCTEPPRRCDAKYSKRNT